MRKNVLSQFADINFSQLQLQFVGFVIVLLLASCAGSKIDSTQHKVATFSPKELVNAEKILGTHTSGTKIYHNIVATPDKAVLAFDGYIVGVEKGPKKRVSNYKTEVFYNDYANNICQYLHNRLQKAPKQDVCYNAARVQERDEILQKAWDRNGLIHDLLKGVGWKRLDSDKKRHFVSHIFSYSKVNNDQNKILITQPYNIYSHIVENDLGNLETGYPNAFLLGKEALENFGLLLKDRLKGEKKYSHIFFCSMGWHSNQESSIRDFNTLIKQINNHAESREKNSSTKFNPLVVGITWPANWNNAVLGDYRSYWNKASDADEIGTTQGAILLNQILQTLEDDTIVKKPKVIVLSHSFGTRLTSSALFLSALALGEENISKRSVDLYIGLEGAVSGNRFLASKGNEGQPYRLDAFPDTTFVYTWSKHDDANSIPAKIPIISGAKHIGSKSGFKNLKKAVHKRTDTCTLKRLYFIKAMEKDKPSEPYSYEYDESIKWVSGDENLFYLDASEIIKQGSTIGVGAHNDIFNDEVGALLYDLITDYPPSVVSNKN